MDDCLSTLAAVRLASTEQIARAHFGHAGSTSKRASEVLHDLEMRKQVEGESIGFGKPKVWRLTKRARDQMGITWRPPVLVSRKTAHWLALTDCYLALAVTEAPQIWVPEYRESIEDGLMFAPDAWCVWRRKPLFFEVQLTDLTTDGWRQKWKRYECYYQRLAHRAIQPKPPARPVKPVIAVVSRQQNSTIGAPKGVEIIRGRIPTQCAGADLGVFAGTGSEKGRV